MSTFREIAAKLVEEVRDELAVDGVVDDRAGVLVGAMVDAATIAVQDWLREGAALLNQGDASRRVVDGLIKGAGRETAEPPSLYVYAKTGEPVHGPVSRNDVFIGKIMTREQYEEGKR